MDKCPSLLSSKEKSEVHSTWFPRSPVRLNLSHHDSNQARSTLPQPLLLSEATELLTLTSGMIPQINHLHLSPCSCSLGLSIKTDENTCERDGDFRRRLRTSLVENQLANAGHMGSFLVRRKILHAIRQLSPCMTVFRLHSRVRKWEPMHLKPVFSATKPAQCEAHRIKLESSPCYHN